MLTYAPATSSRQLEGDVKNSMNQTVLVVQQLKDALPFDKRNQALEDFAGLHQQSFEHLQDICRGSR